ncbi:hypothetical protein BN2537_3863 [Streptomyces venezuelae]|nr:hypothetical protein BN2537_3863 [Streptomyces venezuelae]
MPGVLTAADRLRQVSTGSRGTRGSPGPGADTSDAACGPARAAPARGPGSPAPVAAGRTLHRGRRRSCPRTAAPHGGSADVRTGTRPSPRLPLPDPRPFTATTATTDIPTSPAGALRDPATRTPTVGSPSRPRQLGRILNS